MELNGKGILVIIIDQTVIMNSTKLSYNRVLLLMKLVNCWHSATDWNCFPEV